MQTVSNLTTTIDYSSQVLASCLAKAKLAPASPVGPDAQAAAPHTTRLCANDQTNSDQEAASTELRWDVCGAGRCDVQCVCNYLVSVTSGLTASSAALPQVYSLWSGPVG